MTSKKDVQKILQEEMAADKKRQKKLRAMTTPSGRGADLFRGILKRQKSDDAALIKKLTGK
jgi:hypothetical protein